MNPLRWGFRAQFLLGFLICAGLLGYAIFVQLQLGIEPCPLCIFQRIAFAALGVLFLLGALHGPRSAGGRKLYGVLAFLAALVGAGISTKHVSVQLFPDPMASCRPAAELPARDPGTVRGAAPGADRHRRLRQHRLALPRPVDADVVPDLLRAAGRVRALCRLQEPPAHADLSVPLLRAARSA